MAPKNCFSTATLAILVSIAVPTHAQEKSDQLPGGYPARPIRILVGLPPGGGIDTIARAVAQKFSERWKRPVVVDNRPGARGIIAMEIVAKAAPDGYTILAGTNGTVTNTLLGYVPFEIQKAYVPIVKLTSQPYLLVTHPALPVSSVKDLIALARSKPGALNYASSGVGSASHLGMELLKSMAGIDIVHVPYKGVVLGISDLLAGQIQMLFSISVTATPHVRSGKLKALGVTSAQRAQSLPDLPTISESGVPGFALSNEYALYAPAGTPAAIVLALNRAGSEIMNSPEMKERLAHDGTEPAPPNSPAEFRQALTVDIVRLGNFIKTSGFKGE